MTDQQTSIIHLPPDQHVCILSGAGCGKTTTLVGRIARFIQHHQIPEHQIIYMTFTKDAAYDMKCKLETVLQYELQSMYIGTIDSIAKQVIEKYATELFESCTHVGEYKYNFLHFLRKQHCPYRKEFMSQIRYIFIDEFQDIHSIYYDILKEFVHHGSVFLNVVGDDNQNIYTWNGSTSKYLLQFHTFFPNLKNHNQEEDSYYLLTQNFRSTPEIISLANCCISFNQDKFEKEVTATRSSIGKIPEIQQFDSWEKEYRFIHHRIIMWTTYHHFSYGDIVLLARSIPEKAQMYYLEEQLSKDGIPNQLLVTTKDIRNPIKENHVILSTIHKSKALEWKCVIVIGCRYKEILTDRLEEERRLFYVAITRAKEFLYFTCTSRKKNDYHLFLREIRQVAPTSVKYYYNGMLMFPPEETYDTLVSSSFLSMDPYVHEMVSARYQSITRIISTLLTTEDMMMIKQHESFPPVSNPPVIKFLYESREYPSWVTTHHLYPEFGLWLDQMICYQIDPTNINQEALKLVHPLYVDAKLYNVYYCYKHLYDHLFDIYSSSDSMIVDLFHYCEDHRDLWTLIEPRQTLFFQLMSKILKKANEYQITPSMIFVCKKSFLSPHAWGILKNAKEQCQQPTASWKENMYPLFILSWSCEIQKGRKRMLYSSLVQESDIQALSPFLQDIKEHIVDSFFRSMFTSCTCKLHLSYENYHCECDFYAKNDTESHLLDCKVSVSEVPSTEHWIQLLLYACIFRFNHYPVDYIAILNPLRANLHQINIREWNQWTEFWGFFKDQIENKRMHRVSASVPVSGVIPSLPLQKIMMIQTEKLVL